MDMDVIILSHEYPRDSSFLAEARTAGVAIEYPETLFLKLVPPVSVIGVMGACGKSSVVSMLAPMLEDACAKNNQNCVVADAESEDGILVHLKKLKSGDIVVMKIASAMMRKSSSGSSMEWARVSSRILRDISMLKGFSRRFSCAEGTTFQAIIALPGEK